MNPSSGDRIPTHLQGEALEHAIGLAEARLHQGLFDMARDFNVPGTDTAWNTLVDRLSSINTSSS
ncbi:MAG: hypothetical protein AAB440_03535 [Patescibacteria group bacterium]